MAHALLAHDAYPIAPAAAVEEYARSDHAHSAALGDLDRWLAEQELAQVALECSEKSWDGYGARPVAENAIVEGRLFLWALFAGLPAPSFGATPDGTVTAEWSETGRGRAVVELSGSGHVAYAALYADGGRRRGFVRFVREIPSEVIELLEDLLVL